MISFFSVFFFYFSQMANRFMVYFRDSIQINFIELTVCCVSVFKVELIYLKQTE